MNNNQEIQQCEQPDSRTSEFYIEMKVWGVLSDILPWDKYRKYCGTVSLHKPVSKVLNSVQRIMFEDRIANKFGFNFSLKASDRIIDVAKQIINL